MNMHYDRSQGKVPRRQALIAGLLVMALAGPSLAQSRPIAKVWKDPSCGCCKDWSLTPARRRLRCAGSRHREHRSAHAAGHPAEVRFLPHGADRRLCHRGSCACLGHSTLAARSPQAIGLAAPGMPVGSPGMDGPAYGGRKDAYDVLLIGKNGSSTVYQSHR